MPTMSQALLEDVYAAEDSVGLKCMVMNNNQSWPIHTPCTTTKSPLLYDTYTVQKPVSAVSNGIKTMTTSTQGKNFDVSKMRRELNIFTVIIYN